MTAQTFAILLLAAATIGLGFLAGVALWLAGTTLDGIRRRRRRRRQRRHAIRSEHHVNGTASR